MKILDAIDELSTAKNLTELVLMSVRHELDEDDKAISAGAYAVLKSIENTEQILEELRAEASVSLKEGAVSQHEDSK